MDAVKQIRKTWKSRGASLPSLVNGSGQLRVRVRSAVNVCSEGGQRGDGIPFISRCLMIKKRGTSFKPHGGCECGLLPVPRHFLGLSSRTVSFVYIKILHFSASL